MKIQEVLDKTTKFFKEKKFESARLDAELLISNALGLRRLDLYLKFDQPLDETEVEKCRALVKRRTAGEPVAYILKKKEFFGFEFLVDPRVLIPRPETELMVELALARIEKSSISTPDQIGAQEVSIIDLGCGSGCISLSLLAKVEKAQAQLVDASEEALKVSRENAERLGVVDRCQFVFQKVQTANLGEADIVVANPPYIAIDDDRVEPNVRIFEPHGALFADDGGFKEIYDWSAKAAAVLKPGGTVFFEIGMDQATQTKNRFAELGLQEIRVHQDLSGRDRLISAIR